MKHDSVIVAEVARKCLLSKQMKGFRSKHNLFNMHTTSSTSNTNYIIFCRAFVTGAQVAQCPSASRLVEAIMIRLTDQAIEQRVSGPGTVYLSKWKVVLLKYNALRNTVANSRLYEDTNLQLCPVNETTISKW